MIFLMSDSKKSKRPSKTHPFFNNTVVWVIWTIIENFFSAVQKIPQIDSSNEQYEAILLANYVSTELQLKRLISN